MFSYKDDQRLDEIERHLHERLRYLQEQYASATQPIINQLVQIQNMRQPRISMPTEDAKRLGFI